VGKKRGEITELAVMAVMEMAVMEMTVVESGDEVEGG